MTTAEHMIVVALLPLLGLLLIDILVNGFEISAEPEPVPEPKANIRPPELGIELALAIHRYRMEHDEVR
jgi:hypothetical protein